MDALRNFLEEVQKQELARGNFLGFLHLLIGRRISQADGTLISNGLTWRELAGWLKKVHWDIDAARELGLNPDDLAPRDRQRYWYTAIHRAGVDSRKAAEAAEKLAELLAKHGYSVGPPPKR